MNKQAPLIPAFFDLPSSASSTLPINLIKEWVESDRSPETEQRLLNPYKRTGIVVASDAAGLSKLSSQYSLIEVMRMINEPKELIHAHGTAIGGTAIGTWAADNTQMFYDYSIDPNKVVQAMQNAQAEITEKQIQVGIGMHYGEVYLLQNSLYGSVALENEETTEEQSNAGDILLSKELFNNITIPTKHKQQGSMIRIEKAESKKPTQNSNPFYPAPFPKSFHQQLRAEEVDTKALEQEYTSKKVVLLSRIFHKPYEQLLDTLTARVIGNEFLHQSTMHHEVEMVKTNGELAIYVCNDIEAAKRCAEQLQTNATDAQLQLNTGIAEGEILLFNLENGEREIAGMPVNIASKLAEDTSERGIIFIESKQDRTHNGYTLHTETKSGIEITTWKKAVPQNN